MQRTPSLDWHLHYRPMDTTAPCCYADCEAPATHTVVGDGKRWWTEEAPLLVRTTVWNEGTKHYDAADLPQAHEFCAEHAQTVSERRNDRVVPGMVGELVG
jgi:hypothetical protein